MQRILFNFRLAIEQVGLNRLRSFLTALGIIFGVGAVIAMLAIGAGARQAILDQMKLIGANNILVRAVKNVEDGTESGGGNGDSNKKPISSGLNLQDMLAIQEVISEVDVVSPEVEISTNILRDGVMEKAYVMGVTNDFFDLNRLDLSMGRFFHDLELTDGSSVCIIGKNIQNRFFSDENPIGRKIKCGNNWLTVIGVLQKRNVGAERRQDLGIRDNNSDVYVPVNTALVRFKNRARFAQEHIGRDGDNDDTNYHQLDRMTIRINGSDKLQAAASVVARILKRRHEGLVDFEIIVPELLLEQEQQTQDTFNLVLAAIACISLLVGGIGIMNIMLASVLERIKEIGIRRSLGATEQDIIQQFLFEAVFISLVGGMLGIAMGMAGAHLISVSADIPTVISFWSIVISFSVASAVGLVFGIVPARRAAALDPITALRSD
ncbi:MAG: ABC transporter permease [Lewinella sp.]|nr:ABC transporter permease [Lewinella sp.]